MKFGEYIDEAKKQNTPKYVPKSKDDLKKLIMDETVNLGDIDTHLITDMSLLFMASNRKDFSGIEKWDVSNVTTMEGMFWGCGNLTADLRKRKVKNVVNADDMFKYCWKMDYKQIPKFKKGVI